MLSASVYSMAVTRASSGSSPSRSASGRTPTSAAPGGAPGIAAVGRTFILGLPMNCATKRLAGRS